MNTCPAQQIMKHCHHDSAQQGLPLINYPACLRDPTVELEQHGDDALRNCAIGLKGAEIFKHKNVSKTCMHRITVTDAHSSGHTDVASGFKHACLPLQCDSKQTQSNEIHCREPVSSTVGERQSGRDRDAHTLYHVLRQSTNGFPPQQIHQCSFPCV